MENQNSGWLLLVLAACSYALVRKSLIMESVGVVDRELLDALSSRNFRCLRNYGDRWGISHVSFDGVSIGEIFDTDISRLCDLWIELNQAIEIQRGEASTILTREQSCL